MNAMTKSGNGPRRPRHPATNLVHDGRDPASQYGFVNPPVYRGSTVLFPTVEKLEAYDQQPYKYGRYATPTVTALEDSIRSLEGGARTILTASGYQAVSTSILAFVEAGDHILMVDSVYQPTRKFCDFMLAKLGVTTTYYDPLVGGGIGDLVQPKTRLIYTESPGSLTFQMQDIPAIAAVAKARGLWLLMDNTWATPLYYRPLAHGVDVSIQAGTKYIVGHADAMLGAVTANERAERHIDRARVVLGVCPGSEETYLGLRGMRTLDVRLDRHKRSGLEIARWLESRPEVARVLHPALPSNPGHALWKRDFAGASGLFSVILKPVAKKAVTAMLDGLELFGMGYSWGGYESLIIPFDPTSYRTATRWKAEGPALRLHVGLEDVRDLIADLEAGFARLKAAS
jgi:cysteine-S-conjugate beta-lyase